MSNTKTERVIFDEIGSLIVEPKFFPEIKISSIWPTYERTDVKNELKSIFKVRDMKNLKISDQEIEEEIQEYRKNKRKN